MKNKLIYLVCAMLLLPSILLFGGCGEGVNLAGKSFAYLQTKAFINWNGGVTNEQKFSAIKSSYTGQSLVIKNAIAWNEDMQLTMINELQSVGATSASNQTYSFTNNQITSINGEDESKAYYYIKGKDIFTYISANVGKKAEESGLPFYSFCMGGYEDGKIVTTVTKVIYLVVDEQKLAIGNIQVKVLFQESVGG